MTTVCLTKVTAAHLRTYYKLTGGRSELFTFSRDAAMKKNILAEWEASLKRGGSCDICEQAVASLPCSISQRSPPSPSQRLLSSIVQRYSIYAYMQICTVREQTQAIKNGLFVNGFTGTTVPTVTLMPCSSTGIRYLPAVMFTNGTSQHHAYALNPLPTWRAQPGEFYRYCKYVHLH